MVIDDALVFATDHHDSALGQCFCASGGLLSAVPADFCPAITGGSRAGEMSFRQAVPNDHRVVANRKKIRDTSHSVVLTLVEMSGYQSYSHRFCVSDSSRLRDGVTVF